MKYKNYTLTTIESVIFKMNIRRAQEKDIPRLIELLEQVLQIHADIRPDIFIPGTTKYTNEELAEMIKDDTKPIYVAADDDDVCMGYAFCQIRQQPFSNNMVPFTSLFIDDLCVDAKTRGAHIGDLTRKSVAPIAWTSWNWASRSRKVTYKQ